MMPRRLGEQEYGRYERKKENVRYVSRRLLRADRLLNPKSGSDSKIIRKITKSVH